MYALFHDLPDDARLWVNPVDRDLSTDEQERALEMINGFIAGWSSHGRNVLGKAEIVADRFILIAAHIPGGDVSGCGIDASVHALGEVAEALGFGWVSGLDVLYLENGRVRQANRARFAGLAAEGSVTAETVVFDVSVTTLRQIRNAGFGLPAHASWHGKVFGLQAASV